MSIAHEDRGPQSEGRKAPGHPERGHPPGVEVTTGPLGQGLANAIGMAIGEASLAARYNRDGHTPIDHHTWSIISDGDLMEGVASEAASLAGHLKLGKLICLYDENYVTLSAGTDITFFEDRAKRFEAYGWPVDPPSGQDDDTQGADNGGWSYAGVELRKQCDGQCIGFEKMEALECAAA